MLLEYTHALPRIHSEETRAKLSAALLGHACSPETRAKIGDSKKGNTNCVGRVLSAETRAKIGAASRGRKRSEETKAKMAATQRAKREKRTNG